MMNRFRSALLVIACIAGGHAAMADVVAVVSTRSPVTALSKNQLLDIFLGRANRYPDGTPASPIDQAEGSPLRDEFYIKVAGQTAAQMLAYWSKIIFTGRGQPPPTVSTDAEMKKRIRDNPAAIGYIDRAAVDDSVRIVF
jgi:ABC-type phosphate transport system substrate-binding protein